MPPLPQAAVASGGEGQGAAGTTFLAARGFTGAPELHPGPGAMAPKGYLSWSSRNAAGFFGRQTRLRRVLRGPRFGPLTGFVVLLQVRPDSDSESFGGVPLMAHSEHVPQGKRTLLHAKKHESLTPALH